MPYEIMKGQRPPRHNVRYNFIRTREMLEGRIPAIINLPKLEQQIPTLPDSTPTLPQSIWRSIIYPYDVFQRVRGMVSGEPSGSSTESSLMPDRKVKTV